MYVELMKPFVCILKLVYMNIAENTLHVTILYTKRTHKTNIVLQSALR